MQIVENKILQHLNELPPNKIYYISPRPYFQRGFEYYREGRVSNFTWSKNNQLLTAKVIGSSAYSVYFSIIKDNLKYECNCPVWSPSLHCKHVICALVTIKNTMNPDLFVIPLNQRREQYISLLEKNLFLLPETSGETLSSDALPQTYEVIIEKDIFLNMLKLSIEENGRPVPRHRLLRLPADLHPIINYDGYYYRELATPVLDYLENHSDKYPLLIKIDKTKIPLKRDKSLVFNTSTEIAVTGQTVTIKRLCQTADYSTSGFHLLGKRLVADVESGRLGTIDSKNGWTIWHILTNYLRGFDEYSHFDDDIGTENFVHYNGANSSSGTDIEIPLRIFQATQISIPDDAKDVLNCLIFKVNQEESVAEETIPINTMIIEPHGTLKGRMSLKACCNISGNITSTSELYFEFFSYLQNRRSLSLPLKARKRWSVLVKTFMSLLSVEKKGEAEKIIKEALSNGDFVKRSVRQEAKAILMDAFSRINTKSSRIQYLNGKWYSIKDNMGRESLLYSVPLEIFGPDIFHGMESHNEMSVNSKDIYHKLPVLSQRLKEHGIPLFFKGKPVVTSTWDFSFDATRNKGIDWFEIRPEIKCDGKLIGDAQWAAIITQDGVLEKEDTIQVLDSNSQDILKTISSIYQENRSSLKKEKDIVHIPRLKILDWIYLRNRGVKVILSKEDEELIGRLSSFEKIEKKPLPDKLDAKLRHYQMEGYYWLAFLYEYKFGACLADDMGLGKTIQAITLLAGIKEGKVRTPEGYVNLPHLIVLPPSLLFNWENEIKRFYPAFKVHSYTGKERSTDFQDSDIILTTYGLVRRDIEKLKKERFNTIVFDEAQTVKNIYADTTGAVRQLNGHFKLTMTGTPLENHIGEYFSILDLSIPGLLGDYDDFKSHIRTETSPLIEIILRRTRPFVLRRTKDKILKELPPKTESNIYLELTDKQKALYKKTVDMVRRTIADAYDKKTVSQAQIIALTAILKLRQICVSPKLIEPMFSDSSPKIEFLIHQLTELLEEGHSALVFSQFTSFLDILEDDLKKHKIAFSRLDGSTAVGKRKHLVEGFQNDEKPAIFLLSLKAGGQGLNLTKASYVFHLDPWWNPAVENQASDRAHRIGQNNRVTIMRILMRHTVEEKMMALKDKKLALYNAVMGESMSGKKGLSISKSDFDYLLEGGV